MTVQATEDQLAFDRRLIPLEWDAADPTRAAFELTESLCRTDGVLFGGAALSASLMAFEGVSGRPALWTAVQFVASADRGAHIELQLTVVAKGRNADQLQLHATSDGQLIFSALGTTATRREDGIAGLGLTPPKVVPPEDCVRWGDAPSRVGSGHQLISEFRGADLIDPDPARPGHMAMWGRVLDSTVTTSAKLGFLADMVPIASCRAAGIQGAGTSLDNTLRLGDLVETEWVLVELEGQAVNGGYGHGVTHLWSPDGQLMAIGSQSAKLFSFADFMDRWAGGGGGAR